MEEGTFAAIVDPERSQCIQRSNTLEVKTPGLIVLIIMPLTYISKVATLQVGVVAVTTILKLF
jgi:energy-converting hydrogenase Eha subunit E